MVEVVIGPGMGVREIAGYLKTEKLINSSALFQFYVVQEGLVSSLQAGVYQLPAHLSLVELVDHLGLGVTDLELTFLEGWRREEMAAYIDKKSVGLGFNGDEFLGFSQGLEGYLFPDTYFISKDMTAADTVNLMRATFAEKADEEVRAGLAAQGLTLNEGVILASIVEREVATPEDRPWVAGVLVKRYQRDWPLEADATVQYVLGGPGDWWPKEIGANLDVDSPYNTRIIQGLPPAPICNPGRAALEAVAFPQVSSYWFYVSDEEGRMHYAETVEEHEGNVVRYVP